MPNGLTPEEERRRQELERRYKKAEEEARAAWQRGLENEQEASEALKEEKKTHTGKRRVSFDSSRNQTHLYRDPSQISSASANSTDAGKPSDEPLQRQQDQGHTYRQSISETEKRRQEAHQEWSDKELQLKEKEIASLRAELEALDAKEVEEKELGRKKQEYEAAQRKHEAWMEQERRRQKAEEEALKAKEAEESVLARIRQEGEAARRKYDEALRQKADEEALKRDLENEGQPTSQPNSQKPEQGSYAPKPSAQQHSPVRQYPSTSSSYLKHHPQWHHPHPDQTLSASPVPVGLSGLPAESLCSGVAPPHHTPSVSSVPVGLSGLPAISLSSDAAPEVTRYRDEGRGRSGHADAYGSKEQEHSHQERFPSVPRPNWSTPPVPAWKDPTPEPQVTKQTLVLPASLPYHVSAAGLETLKKQWPLPPTPASSKIQPRVPTPPKSEKEKLERELREEKRKYEELARRRAELEKKGRGNGASSMATWQTGCKSVWEDPTTVTPKNIANDSFKPPVAGNQHDARKSRWERGMEGPIGDSSVNRNDRSISRMSNRSRYYEAEEYLSPSDDDRKPNLTKAQTRASALKLSVPLGTNPPYVPPTPYWHPSPPPSLPPTPPKRSSDPAPVVAGPSNSSPKSEIDYYGDIKTPYPPGSWWGDEREPYRLVQ